MVYQQPPKTKWAEAASIVGRCLAGAFGVAALVIWLLIVWTVLSSAYATDPAEDPHGYGLIFGVLAYIPFGLAWVLALPLALPKRLRARGMRIAMLLFVTVTVLGVVALYLS
ncbi:hypothetical protein [Mycolicibacterium wolinskyi]|uniref:hypothetical protein n=1 Tax=Mycolicibacterium wolinskyi TaxID=59750 RepID=UPI0039179849